MDWNITGVKYLKTLGYVFVGGIISTLVAPEFSDAAKTLAEHLAGGIPVIGGAVKGVLSSLLLGGLAAAAAALDNARKHWND